MVDATLAADIAKLIRDVRPHVRTPALDIVLGLSVTPEQLIEHAAVIAAPLLECIMDAERSADAAESACKSLVNLTGDDRFQRATGESLVESMVDAARAVVCDAATAETLADAGAMLLCNTTRREKFASRLVPHIATLVDRFCLGAQNGVHHVALVLCNVSQTVEGRNELANRDRVVLERLLPFLSHANATRRTGIVQLVRNVCFDAERHDWLLSDKINLLPHLLLPLAGPEELSDSDMEGLPDELQYLPEEKTREPDIELRRALLQALTQLCTTLEGRQRLRDAQVYVIVREYHKWEPEAERMDEDVMALVQLLMGDESGITNLKTCELPEHAQKKIAEDLEKNASEQE